MPRIKFFLPPPLSLHEGILPSYWGIWHLSPIVTLCSEKGGRLSHWGIELRCFQEMDVALVCKMDKVARSRVWEGCAVFSRCSDMFWGALLYKALKIITVLVICYVKPGLVTRTNELLIHTFLFLWCTKITGPGKIYVAYLKAQDKQLKEDQFHRDCFLLSSTVSCLFKLLPMWHLSGVAEPSSE